MTISIACLTKYSGGIAIIADTRESFTSSYGDTTVITDNRQKVVGFGKDAFVSYAGNIRLVELLLTSTAKVFLSYLLQRE